MPNWFLSILAFFKKPIVAPVPTMTTLVPPVKSIRNVINPKKNMPQVPPKYLFDSQQNAKHTVRVICDEMLPLERNVLIDGKMYLPKDVIYACIEQESDFYNYLPSGNPTVCHNKNAAGVVTSSDWGICQINDTKGWYIGPAPLPFPSVEFLLANPELAVRFMIKMYKGGQLDKWVSYSSGAFKQFLPQN